MSASSAIPSLHGRRILLGVAGGIAAYKAADLTRRLVEAGADVQVVMSEAAKHFVGAATFQALSGKPVRDSLWDAQAESAMGHIELARWPDLILIAPATADVIARLAQGRADDLMTTLVLASDKPLAIAPAMNRLMWSNAATQANVAALIARGVNVLGPGAGFQACGEVGEGRMREPTDLRADVASLLSSGPLSGKHVVVTAGPTREPIDPVRFITNRSSGKQGYALALALAQLGARVTLISGPTNLGVPPGATRIDVESAQQMCDAALEAAKNADLFVGAAAVADYRAAEIAGEKIKKKGEAMSLALTRTDDILVRVRAAQPDLFIVGFAAETEKLEAHAREKLTKKKLDLIAANWVGQGRAFDRDDNQLSVFWDGGGRELAQAGKDQLARELAALIVERLHIDNKKHS
ncbi:phosphopantothenate-cysteine ligase /phosphopantothenoylcysteine decarboxylase [Panacagrimonas perspica]|uniref:Coenzyme A biosynthesis bifunctional protein CoaBC n=1 Tax=Panacagrimonas perspica TaxID=381431 RepID=A0A4R7P3I5_9GAMM|nr:bifunctional phosphopantothenoylcysteine decarboxylase/phosphopantothenate--cysteine ligase CoaBC [Panacagrimonas perspica]TDU28217.1 phosphopantothenate-cysteine ligase /phosphopantothenoylcysteine decarboxylase [Panacagrimonas perspica]THD01299.1 bifunctional 4'-phosphopantothenoylcysteine decarboxylase/phosphopantothenoylcysteine synthetase [Panacagrimonas perspica]